MKNQSAALLITLLTAGSVSAGTFTPKTYIKQALDSSPAMKMAEQAYTLARETYRSALADAALPAFKFSAAETLYGDDNTGWDTGEDRVSSSLSASWNLYDSASSPLSRVRSARLTHEYARLTLLIARQTQSLSALDKFYALYSAQQKVVAARSNLASREKQYNDTNEQFQSGTRSRIELTQSEGDKLSSELSLAQAEFGERKALMAFNELINAEPDEAQAVVIDTNAVSIKLPLPKEDIDRALEGNLKFRLRKVSLERTKLTGRNAIMADYPRFRLDADWAKTSLPLFGSGRWTDNQSYGLAASVSYSFGFFGAQKHYDLLGQKASIRSAELDLEDARRTLKTDVLTAQKNIELLVKSRQLLDFQVKAQKDTMDNLMGEFSLGGASSLQLDNSQTKLLDASNSQISAVNDLDLALAGYRVLLGERIWE